MTREEEIYHKTVEVDGIFEQTGKPLTPDELVNMRKQVAEDTCEEHGVFCCDICFDMTPVE